MKNIRIAVAICFGANLSGCLSDQPIFLYQGSDEVVLLCQGQKEDSSTFLISQELRIAEVDGKPTRGKPSEVHMSPGKHDIGLYFSTPKSNAGGVGTYLWFVGEPGHRYRVKYGQSGFGNFTVAFWIEDEAGARVGGILDYRDYIKDSHAPH
ncbi:MAG TPA: hypothetical protein VFA75_07925 [Nevskia sp.]|jgi:hypothetical protein|nr:hypothetical protein [Nevskia sp.]